MAKKPVLESAVMNVLWNADTWLTPREVGELLPEERKVAYTTVMTVLTRLWRKGMVDRRRQGRAYGYQAKLPRSTHAAQRMEEILEATGDRSLTLSRFLETLSASEREQLRELLE